MLEHYLLNSFDIVKTVSSVLKPGGIMSFLEKHANFDPYMVESYMLIFVIGNMSRLIYASTPIIVFLVS